MTQAIEQLAIEIGELLAASPMDQKVKDIILKNLDTIPENLIFRLRDALVDEKEEIDGVIFDIELFMKEQDERWTKLEEDQQKAATDMADELFEKLKDKNLNSGTDADGTTQTAGN